MYFKMYNLLFNIFILLVLVVNFGNCEGELSPNDTSKNSTAGAEQNPAASQVQEQPKDPKKDNSTGIENVKKPDGSQVEVPSKDSKKDNSTGVENVKKPDGSPVEVPSKDSKKDNSTGVENIKKSDGSPVEAPSKTKDVGEDCKNHGHCKDKIKFHHKGPEHKTNHGEHKGHHGNVGRKNKHDK